jgi:prepilin-type processing-associated H-X9-DG protein
MSTSYLTSIDRRFRAFTLVECLVIVVTLAFLGSVLVVGVARTHTPSESIQCRNSLRQLAQAWRQYSEDNKDLLLTCQTIIPPPAVMAVRTNWMEGNLDFSSSPGNWDPYVYVYTSPMFRYCGKDPLVFRCPADKSMVMAADDSRQPRIRSRSMNSAFSRGDWLANFNTSQTVWRIYRTFSNIVRPANTFVFIDEHPDSINDSVFSSACTGNQATDPPTASWIIDFPANYHNGGCGMSFADGHCEIHKWVGSKIARAPITYTGNINLNIHSGDSWLDMHWLAENTTIRNQ